MSLSLGLKDFLLQSSSVFNGFPGILCDPRLPLPLPCSKVGFAGLLCRSARRLSSAVTTLY